MRSDKAESHLNKAPRQFNRLLLVAINHADKDGALRGQRLSAESCALAKASPNVSAEPITSPVDFISGPSTVSTPGNLFQGKTGDLTKYPAPVARSRPFSTFVGKNSRNLRPVIRRAAILASGTPVALET